MNIYRLIYIAPINSKRVTKRYHNIILIVYSRLMNFEYGFQNSWFRFVYIYACSLVSLCFCVATVCR